MAIELSFKNVILNLDAYRKLDTLRRWAVRQAFQWRPAWFRCDDHLMATTFPAPADVRAFWTGLATLTGLRVGEDFVVVDTNGDRDRDVTWLEWDITALGRGYACLTGQPRHPLDEVPMRVPPGSMLVRYAKDRDSVRDPIGTDGKPYRNPACPTWAGTGIWFWSKPGQSADPADFSTLAWDSMDGSEMVNFFADLSEQLLPKA
jgi:hypothetical protein